MGLRTRNFTVLATTLEQAQAKARAKAEADGLDSEAVELAASEAKAATPGRDEGKTYHLTELPPLNAEKWAFRLLMAAMKAGAELPAGITPQSGLAGLAGSGTAIFGILGSIPWEVAEPLMDEMMACVQAMASGNGAPFPRKLVDGDIEEVSTLFQLRREIVELHLGFSFADKFRSLSAGRAAKSQTTT